MPGGTTFGSVARPADSRESLPPGFTVNWWLTALLLLLAAVPTAQAQSLAQAVKPYAALDRESVAYNGPVRTSTKNLPAHFVIGLILPLHGSQQQEGNALLAAAQLAVEDEQASREPGSGLQLELVARDESGPWGQASMQILKLFEQDHAVAIVTSANGTSAHLAEQIANKISIPILTLASDSTTTQANIPWLFRLGPSDTDQARAFCHRIYSELHIRRVLLIAQNDHDGRVGAAAFEKAAREFTTTQPMRFDLTDMQKSPQLLQEFLQTDQPDCVVIWTDAPEAQILLPTLRHWRPLAPVFVSRKAAQLDSRSSTPNLAGEFLTLGADPGTSAQKNFEQRYFEKTGMPAGITANELYRAVRMISVAFHITGTNRVLLRDYLAKQGQFRTTEGTIPFDPAGNDLREFSIVRIKPAPSPN